MTKQKRKRKMDQEEIECIICNQTKKRAEYYNTSSYCKVCHGDYMNEKKIEIRREFIHKCISNGKFKLEDFDAADRLLISCQSRHNACKYNQKGYEKIECNYTTPFEFFLVMLKKEGFLTKWIDLYNCWIASGKDRNALPVIDRIDELGHYVPSNVQPLTHFENTFKARRKACTAVLFKNGSLVNAIQFESKTECNERLSEYVPVNVLKKIEYDVPTIQNLGNGYFLKVQTDDVQLEEMWQKVEPDKTYKLLYVLTHYEYTDDTRTSIRPFARDTYEFKVDGIGFVLK